MLKAVQSDPTRKSRFSLGKKLIFLLFIIRYSLLAAYSQVNLEWVSRYNGTGNGVDWANSIFTDALGNVYVTGYSHGFGTDKDYVTIKYNPSGTQMWEARYSEPGISFDLANSITVDLLGNVYVTGSSEVLGGSKDYATVKYDPSGTEQWVARYNGPENDDDRAYSVALDASGNVYVTGRSGNAINYGWDYATIKYNSSGLQQWATRYNGPGNGFDWAHSIAVDVSGNVYVTGESLLSGSNWDYATIKYSATGSELWVARYNGPGNGWDKAYSIVVDSSSVYVTGCSTGPGTSFDYASIKYSQLIGIQSISNEIPEKLSLSQNYPNPFNPSTTIRFDIPSNVKSKTSNVKLRIYDVLGREIAALVNEMLNPGCYEVDWDGGSFASGVYYYTLQAGSYKETRKMILIK